MKTLLSSIAANLAPLSLCLLASCSQANEEPRQARASQASEPAPVNMAPALTPPLTQLSPTPSAKSGLAAPPNPDEVRNAVSRVFGKVASAEFSGKPAFITGDFNGDGSEDLAVLIRANDGQTGEINNELANWVLEDPKTVALRKTNSPAAPKAARAEKDEILLAIIHGAGAQGWRSQEAKQTYLLKNEGATTMTSQSLRNLQGAKDKQELPPLKGDTINETLNGKPGIIYWTGAKYAWHGTSSK